jgi:hypothetical protein
VPHATKLWAIGFQTVACIAAVGFVAYAVVQCRRERRLTLDAMILIAWLLTYWHDPLINYLRPTILYNAYLVNLGSWVGWIPGWVSPGTDGGVEPLLLIGTAYIWMGLGFGMLATAIMRRIHGRWSDLGATALFLATLLVVFPIELGLEAATLRMGLDAYPSAIHSLTIWAGQTYQLPVYGALGWSAVLTGLGALRYWRDGLGRTVVERGAERLTVSKRRLTVVRLLAVVAFAQVICLGYDAMMIGASLHPGKTADYPSYLRTTQCGPGTAYPCPGPGVPIWVRR